MSKPGNYNVKLNQATLCFAIGPVTPSSSPSREVTFFQLISKFPRFYRSRSFIYIIHKNSFPDPINNQMISAHSLSHCFFTTPRPRPPKWHSPVLWILYTTNVELTKYCYTAGSLAEEFNLLETEFFSNFSTPCI